MVSVRLRLITRAKFAAIAPAICSRLLNHFASPFCMPLFRAVHARRLYLLTCPENVSFTFYEIFIQEAPGSRLEVAFVAWQALTGHANVPVKRTLGMV